MFKHFIICSLLAAASLSASEKIYPVFFKQDPGIVIDGKLTLDDWGDIKNELRLLPGKGKEGKGKSFSFKGEKDISATVKFAYRYDGTLQHDAEEERHQCDAGALYRPADGDIDCGGTDRFRRADF